MIYFQSVACHKAFMDAVTATPQLWTKCFQLLNRQKPCALYLVACRDVGKYFDFGVFSLTPEMVLVGDSFRPDLTPLPQFEAVRDKLIVNGGLCLREDAGKPYWSSHT